MAKANPVNTQAPAENPQEVTPTTEQAPEAAAPAPIKAEDADKPATSAVAPMPKWPGLQEAKPGVEYMLPSGNTIMTPGDK